MPPKALPKVPQRCSAPNLERWALSQIAAGFPPEFVRSVLDDSSSNRIKAGKRDKASENLRTVAHKLWERRSKRIIERSHLGSRIYKRGKFVLDGKTVGQ